MNPCPRKNWPPYIPPTAGAVKGLESVQDAAGGGAYRAAMTRQSPASYATVFIGASGFRARIEADLAPASCRALIGLLPYHGTLLHARWSGESLWSPLRTAWPAHAALEPENAVSEPRPGQLLLYAGPHSEAEILVPYGATRFACKHGPLLGNPVLTILERLDELAPLGRAVLESGAVSLRIELAHHS